MSHSLGCVDDSYCCTRAIIDKLTFIGKSTTLFNFFSHHLSVNLNSPSLSPQQTLAFLVILIVMNGLLEFWGGVEVGWHGEVGKLRGWKQLVSPRVANYIEFYLPK